MTITVGSLKEFYDDGTPSEIAQDIFELLVGSSVALANVPSSASDSLDIISNADLVLTISVSTTSGARLIFSIGCRKDDSAALEADSTTGLLSIDGQDTVTASDASVVRQDGSTVVVTIKAAAMELIGLGGFDLELREINGLNTVSKWIGSGVVRRVAGRITA